MQARGSGGTTQRYKVVGTHGAIIRQTHSTHSAEMGLLQYGDIVEVAEVRGRRARTVKPLEGWCSLVSADGHTMILQPIDSGAAPSDSLASYKASGGGGGLSGDIAAKDREIARLQSQVRDLNSRLESGGGGGGGFGDSGGMRNEIRELKGQKLALTRKLSEAQFELHALQERVEDMAAEHESGAAEQNDEVRRQLSAKNGEIMALKGKYDASLHELEASKEDSHRLERKLKKKLKEAEAELAEMRDNVGNPGEQDQMRRTIKTLEKRIAALNFENKDVKHLRSSMKRLQREVDNSLSEMERHKRRADKSIRALAQQRRAAHIERREIADALQEHQKQVEQVLMRERRKSIVLQRSLEDVRQYLGQKDGEISNLEKKAQKSQQRKIELANANKQLAELQRQMQQRTHQFRATANANKQLKNAHGQSESRNRRLSSTLQQMKQQLQDSISRARKRAQRAKRSGGGDDFLATLTNEVKGEFTKYQKATREAALQAFDQIQNYTSMDQMPNPQKSPALPAQTAGGYGGQTRGGGYGGYGQTRGGYGGGYGGTPGGGDYYSGY